MRRSALKASFLMSAGLLLACGAPSEPAPQPGPAARQAAVAAQQPRDPFSFANTAEFTTRRLELDLTVDFERQVLEGSATLAMERLSPTAHEVLLDTRGLDIARATIAVAGRAPVVAEFSLLPEQPRLGQALAVELPGELQSAATFDLRVDYSTRPDSTALQWLAPELTAGRVQPFMFSQSQSIHARSWVPLQDTPSVRITYGATIRTPAGLLAVMSADNDPDTSRDGEYRFEMPQPIPSYLLAIAVGDLWFEPLGARTGIYAERELLQPAAWEFADTQAMLEAAEERYGPYQWGRYDLLILPPSFPFGGMENPRLSFITPSVLAGDRSLVSLIAHELAHSWSGNLVTNATWSDIWLNEGITSYLDARLTEVLYGPERADEERYLSYQDLLSQLQTVKPAMQALAPDLSAGNPDDSQGTVHYAKGQLFLQHLEAVFGRERFDTFLSAYFRQFQWQSITSGQFLDYLDQHLLATEPGLFSRAQAEAWIYGPGVPADATLPRSKTLEDSASAARAWAAGELPTAGLPASQWSPQAVVQFLNSLPPQVTEEALAELDAHLGLSASRNAEIGRAWFTQVAARRHLDAYPGMREFLLRNGRIRLIAPVFQALAANGEDAALAREIFSEARASYHPITVAAIDRRLGSVAGPVPQAGATQTGQ